MKFYSDVTKKFYESAAECEKAENDEKAKLEVASKQRKDAAAKIDKLREEYHDAYQKQTEAFEAYRTALSEFCRTYGAYHYSVSNKEIENVRPWRLLEEFLNW